MGLFDKISTDGTGSMGTFTQQAKAFATLDLNSIFKQAGQAVTSIITNAVSFFHDVFGTSYCNDEDRVLVERMWDQIPGMALMLSDLGYLDKTIGDSLREDPNNIYGWMQTGRPHGAEPCNSLIGPARTLFTILFGIRIRNSATFDAMDNGGEEGYFAHDGYTYQWDISWEMATRAVMLKRNFFGPSTYNTQQWDLNKFQEYPLIAPIPDPLTPGQLYTGEFMGVKIVNGVALGDPVEAIETTIKQFQGTDELSLIDRFPTGTTPAITTTTGQTNFIDTAIKWMEQNPLLAAAIGAAAAVVIYELVEDHQKKKHYGKR